LCNYTHNLENAICLICNIDLGGLLPEKFSLIMGLIMGRSAKSRKELTDPPSQKEIFVALG
jgi:hypothetical protein